MLKRVKEYSLFVHLANWLTAQVSSDRLTLPVPFAQVLFNMGGGAQILDNALFYIV